MSLRTLQQTLSQQRVNNAVPMRNSWRYLFIRSTPSSFWDDVLRSIHLSGHRPLHHTVAPWSSPPQNVVVGKLPPEKLSLSPVPRFTILQHLATNRVALVTSMLRPMIALVLFVALWCVRPARKTIYFNSHTKTLHTQITRYYFLARQTPEGAFLSCRVDIGLPHSTTRENQTYACSTFDYA